MNCLTKTKKHNTIVFTPHPEPGQAGGVSGLVVQTIDTVHKAVKCKMDTLHLKEITYSSGH